MVFVTGATGLVGSYLLLELSKRGESIRAMKRASSNIENVKQLFIDFSDLETFEKIEWVEADLLDVTTLPDVLTGIETIYHTAATIGFKKKSADLLHEVNVIGTANLVNIAIAEKVKNFVFFSSIATLDPLLNETTIDEKSKWNPELTHSDYAISKQKSEMEVWRGSQEGLNVLVLYPSIIIGSFDGKRESEKIFKLASKKKTWATEGITGYVDVRDVAYCTVELSKQGKWEESYILNSDNRSYLEVFNFLRKEWRMDPAQLLSKSKLNLLRLLSGFSQFLGTPHISKANFHALTGQSVYLNEKVKTALDFEFRPVEDGLRFHSARYQSIKNKK